MIAISILLPLGIDFFIFGNQFPSNISNSDWSGFLGSFLGGIFGSIGSIIGISITIMETRNSEYKNDLQKKIQLNKEKLDSIIDYTSILWKEIKTIQKKAENISHNNELLSSYQREIRKIENDLTRNANMPQRQRSSLEAKKGEYMNKIQIISSTLNQINLEYSDLTKPYFMLKIILKDMDIANNYISILDEIYDNICNVCSKDIMSIRIDKDFLSYQQKLQNSFELFVDSYKTEYILINK